MHYVSGEGMVRQQYVLTVINSYAERKAAQVAIGSQAEHVASEIKEEISSCKKAAMTEMSRRLLC